MTEKIELRVGNPPKNKAENGPISATPENLSFFKGEIYNFFLIPVAQTCQNESVPFIFCYAKCTKTAYLQALTPGRVKKITLYNYILYTFYSCATLSNVEMYGDILVQK